MNRETTAMPRVELRPGELYTAGEPTVITTLLGSCISICLYSPALRIGGMCHAVLPAAAGRQACDDPRYVNCALRIMMSELGGMGAAPGLMEAKIFGGADMFPQVKGMPVNVNLVGANNVQAARTALAAARINVVNECVGGPCGRRLLFNSATGEVLVKLVGGPPRGMHGLTSAGG